MTSDALRAWFFVSLGGGVIAALPLIAINNEDIFCVEVVIVKIIDHLLIILKNILHSCQLFLWIDDKYWPFLTALLFTDS